MSEQPVPDKVTVTLVMHHGERQSGQTMEALPVPAAAFLRAVADMLDPPRRPTRGRSTVVDWDPLAAVSMATPDRAQGGIVSGVHVVGER